MNPADLERDVASVLRRLPLPTAPARLAPAVMAAVRALPARHWYRRSWSGWPLWWRLAFFTVAIPGVVALVWAAPILAEGGRRYMVTTSSNVSLVNLAPDEVRRLVGIADLVHLLWRTVLGPLAAYAAAFAVVMGCVCTACATAVARLTDLRAAA